MRMHAVMSPVLVALIASVGCSLITSTDDLTGAVDASVNQAVVSDAAASDVRDDASGDAPVDAPTDVLVDAPFDAPPAPYCSSLMPAPALCEDFDGNGSFDSQFTTAEAFPGHIGSDTAFFKSPGRSFFAKVDTGTASSDTWEFMFKTFSAQASHITFGFDILLAEIVTGQSVVAAAIVINSGMAAEHGLSFVATGQDAAVEESFRADGGWRYLDKALSAFPAPMTWTRVDIDLSLTNRRVSVKIDGVTALSNASLDPSWQVAGPVQINVGMTYVSDTTGPWTIRYDNVVANPL